MEHWSEGPTGISRVPPSSHTQQHHVPVQISIFPTHTQATDCALRQEDPGPERTAHAILCCPQLCPLIGFFESKVALCTLARPQFSHSEKWREKEGPLLYLTVHANRGLDQATQRTLAATSEDPPWLGGFPISWDCKEPRKRKALNSCSACPCVSNAQFVSSRQGDLLALGYLS